MTLRVGILEDKHDSNAARSVACSHNLFLSFPHTFLAWAGSHHARLQGKVIVSTAISV